MNLTASNYYEAGTNAKYMSATQFTSFMRCQSSALAGLTAPRQPTDSMLAGSYLDAMFDGCSEEFLEEHPSMMTKAGTLRAQFARVPGIYQRLQDDLFFMSYAQGETQTILTGDIGGVPFKGRTDFLQDDKIVDLKTTSNFKEMWSAEQKRYITFAEFWRYDIQGAVYQELVYQMTGKRLPFYLAVVTTEPIPDLAILEIPQQDLDTAMDDLLFHLPEIQAVKLGLQEPHRCESCDHCKQTKTLTKVKNWKEV